MDRVYGPSRRPLRNEDWWTEDGNGWERTGSRERKGQSRSEEQHATSLKTWCLGVESKEERPFLKKRRKDRHRKGFLPSFLSFRERHVSSLSRPKPPSYPNVTILCIKSWNSMKLRVEMVSQGTEESNL